MFRKKSYWEVIKYYGNCGIFARCNNCGFEHPIYKTTFDPFKIEIDKNRLWKYCPICGRTMTGYSREIKTLNMEKGNND